MKPELELILKVIPIFISFAALWVAVGRFWAAIYPICLQRRNQRMLEDKFSRGPYDEATIERSTRYYIRPKCSNIDPAQEKELRHALVATREDLFDKADYFLDHDDSHRHLLVLADSGTGKTSFVLNYYAHNARRPKRKRHRLALVPLGVKNADELIANIPNQEDIVLFLDAFDEDTKAIADHHSRIRTLMKACRNFKRVVITCRTQFFPKEEEIPIETGIARLGPRKAGERGVYEFWKLYLSPFDDEDVNHYLKKRYPIWHHRLRKKAREIALKIPLLTARPMLLAHMPDVISSGAEIRHVCELYEIMIEAWLERETVWVDKEALREFSEQLAVNIYLNREARKMERVPREELPELAKVWGMSIPEWKLASRSLLNRDAEGNYKFAHRSIMEYLFVIRLVNGDERCYEVVLTDQMKHFLVEILSISLPELEDFRSLLLDLDLTAQGISEAQLLSLSEPESLNGFVGALVSAAHLVSTDELIKYIIRIPDMPPVYPIEVLRLVARRASTWKRLIDSKTASEMLLSLGPRDLIMMLLTDIPNGTSVYLDVIRHHSLGRARLMREFNIATGWWLEPISPDFDRFVLKFVPLSEKTGEAQG